VNTIKDALLFVLSIIGAAVGLIATVVLVILSWLTPIVLTTIVVVLILKAMHVI
jgi:hypothetical protein